MIRVWPKDEFDQCRDADERDEGAMELCHVAGVWTPSRVGRVLHCPYPIDDAGEAAELYADYFHSHRDGYECTWPIEFVVDVDGVFAVVEVDRDFDPTFLASKPTPLAVTP